MPTLIHTLRAAALAGALCLPLAAGAQDAPSAPAAPNAPAAAQAAPERHNNAPIFREVRRSEAESITFQAPADRRLIQSEGQWWRSLRNGPLTQIGGWVLVAVFLALCAFYLVRGRIKLSEPPSGRKMQRFRPIERIAHWTVAGTFVLLALSGLTMLFGKHVLLPVIGHEAFAWIAWAAKNGHNLLGPLFFASILVFIALFVKDNVWQAVDALWIRKAGGLLSGEHVPSWRFNFGEKTWFWIGVVALGLIVSASGLVLDFPGYGQIRQDMQLAQLIHAGCALAFMALALGHIYIGTLGMEGALDSMKTGYVDETWAKEHHQYWYDAEKGQAPARDARGDTPGAAHH